MNNRTVLLLSGELMPFIGYTMHFSVFDNKNFIGSVKKLDEPEKIDIETYTSHVQTLNVGNDKLYFCAGNSEAEQFLTVIKNLIDRLEEETIRQRNINLQLLHKINSLRQRKLKFLDRIKFILGLKRFSELLPYPQWWEDVDLWRNKNCLMQDERERLARQFELMLLGCEGGQTFEEAQKRAHEVALEIVDLLLLFGWLPPCKEQKG